jgi:alpha-mannosidase
MVGYAGLFCCCCGGGLYPAPPPWHYDTKSTDAENISLHSATAVKRAEDADLLVVRLMETHGDSTLVQLRSALAILGGNDSDLRETTGAVLPLYDGAVQVAMRPWTLRTVLLRVQR